MRQTMGLSLLIAIDYTGQTSGQTSLTLVKPDDGPVIADRNRGPHAPRVHEDQPERRYPHLQGPQTNPNPTPDTRPRTTQLNPTPYTIFLVRRM